MHDQQPSHIVRLLQGALAGAGATLPMTITMYALRHLLLPRETHPLGPNRVMHGVEAKTGLDKHLNQTQHRILLYTSHFSYGALAGMAYVPFAKQHSHYVIPRGMAFGVAVWATSYLGWLPALQIIPPASQRSPYRRVIMISAHLVWGAALSLILSYLQRGHLKEQIHNHETISDNRDGNVYNPGNNISYSR